MIEGTKSTGDQLETGIGNDGQQQNNAGQLPHGKHRRITPPWTWRRFQTVTLWLVILVLIPIGMVQTGVSISTIFGSTDAVWALLQRMVPPSFADWSRYTAVIAETLYMVIAGTALALVLSVLCAIFAARNTTTGKIAHSLSRGIIVFTRSIPTLLLAMIFVRGIGIGPLAGILAMGIHSIGMLGKFFADAVEDIDPGPVEALRSVGANRSQVFLSGVLPQIISDWVSLLLYRFDINVRGAVILGYVGAGGIGLELQRALGQLSYRRALTIVLLMFTLIVTAEFASAFIRRLLQGSGRIAAYGSANPFATFPRFWRLVRRPVEPPLTRSTARPGKSALGEGVHQAPPQPSVRAPWTAARFATWSIILAGIGLVVLSVLGIGITFDRVARIVELPDFFAQMVPPDFATNWQVTLGFLAETFWIAITGTAMGVVLSLPVAIYGARNIAPHWALYRSARLLMLGERGLPELIVAVLLVVAVGLGPFAGVLALGLGAFGMTGKLIADAIEGMRLQGVHDALDATGATWTQRTISATVPQALPSMVGVSLYTLDVNIRAATVLGIVGAGGIGVVLFNTIAIRAFDRTLAVILSIFALVLAVEKLSGWLRKRLI